jgi:ABC-type sugar transport system ATPase subunit
LAEVQLRGVSKIFPGGILAVEPLDLTIPDGELFTLVGPSGSGKSTLLRMIAGLETPTTGTIQIDGRDVTGLTPRDRDVAMVFQHPALYPHLSVFKNLAFGLRARGMSWKELTPRVNDIADLLQIRDVLPRKPRTLSGGQKQRVALGRALVRQPSVFLLDEPMSSLDAALRLSIRRDFLARLRGLGGTWILVTHDQGDALALGDRVAIMNRGRLELAGRPEDAYKRPASVSIARSLGNPPMNVISCSALRQDDDTVRLKLDDSVLQTSFTLPRGPWEELVTRRRVYLGLRPESVIWIKESEVLESGAVCWLSEPFPVFHIEYQGHETITSLSINWSGIVARRAGRVEVNVGELCRVGFRPEDAVWFDRDTGARFDVGLSR